MPACMCLLKIRGRILLAIAKCKSVAPVCMAARPHYVIRWPNNFFLSSIVYFDNPFNYRRTIKFLRVDA